MREEKAEFFIRGSEGDEYRVMFENVDGILKTRCSCKARFRHEWCKHRTAILNGETDDLISENPSGFHDLKQMIQGSPFETAFSEYTKADYQLEMAKAARDKAKRALLREVKIT